MQRVGLGHDTHRLQAGDHIILGGVKVPHNKCFVAHSDGDVLLHALIDALLGALAWGDIGELFPDTDSQYAQADSKLLTQEVVEKITSEAWKVVNVDCIVFAQSPKLSPHKSTIQASVASLLNLDADRVSIKAKTGEHVGPIGREEAISSQVIVLLEKT